MASYNAKIQLELAVGKALERLQRVERAIESTARKAVIDLRVKGQEKLQSAVDRATEGSRRLARSFEQIENKTLSKLPQSLQTVIAYLKTAASVTQSFALAAAGVGTEIDKTLTPAKAYTEEIVQAARAMEQLASEQERLGRASRLASGRGLSTLRASLREREAQRDQSVPFTEEYERLSRQIVQLRSAINAQLRQQESIERNILKYQNDQASAVQRNVRASREAREAAGEGFAKFSQEIDTYLSKSKRLQAEIAEAGGFRQWDKKIKEAFSKYANAIDDIKQIERRNALEQLELEIKLSDNELKKDLQNEEALKRQKEKNLRDLASFDEELAYRVRTKKLKADIQARKARARSDALTGGAFPLLFGAGPAAAAGGALGGFTGGLLGGQFGLALSLLGSQIGTLIDSTVLKVSELGSALSFTTGNVDTIVEALGAAGTPTEDLIKTLGTLEGESASLEEATRRLSLVVGDDGVTALRDFGDAGAKLANAFTQLTTIVLSDVARILGRVAAFAAQETERKAVLESAKRSKNPRLAEAQRELQRAGFATTRRAAEDKLVKIQRQITFEQDMQLRSRIYGARIGADELETLKKRTVILRLNKSLADKERQNAEFALLRAKDERAVKALALKFKKGELDFQEYGRQLEIQQQKSLNNELTLRNKIIAAVDKENKIKPKRKGRDDTARAEKFLNQLRRRQLVLKETTKLEKELFSIRSREEDGVTQIASFQGITEQLREQLSLENQRAASAERIDAALTSTLSKTGELVEAFRPITEEQELLEAKIAGTEKELLIQREVDKILRDRPILSRQAVEQEVRRTEQLREQYKALQFQKEILNSVVNQVGTQLTGLFESLIFQTEDWTKSLNNALKSLASLLFKAGLSALGGDDGKGIFSILSGNFGGKRAMGGPVAGGTSYMVGERGPELFVPRSSGTVIPNNALGGGANVTVNVDASGSNVQGDSNQASQLGKAIGAAVQAELVKQKRPGGLLAGV